MTLTCITLAFVAATDYKKNLQRQKFPYLRYILFPLQVPFDFIGRRAAIENAKMMMEYHLDHLKDVENILQSRKELDSQLTHGYGDTFFPRPSDRGSRRGGRGGRGGRGRQRVSSG